MQSVITDPLTLGTLHTLMHFSSVMITSWKIPNWSFGPTFKWKAFPSAVPMRLPHVTLSACMSAKSLDSCMFSFLVAALDPEVLQATVQMWSSSFSLELNLYKEARVQ